MMHSNFEKIAFTLFISTLVILAFYNLSQEKNTDEYLTRQVGENMEDAKDSRPVIEEIKDRMLAEDVKVDTTATPLPVTLTEVQNMPLSRIARLVDVTGGEEIRGYTTQGEASGSARAGMIEGNYYFYALIDKLPVLKENDYYEVWATRRIPFTYVSLGQLELNELSDTNQYTLAYGSNSDFLYDFIYVSLETQDGNPRPADFVLQGELDKIK